MRTTVNLSPSSRFRSNWTDSGFGGVSYDREAHDGGVKRILGKRGRFDWKDVLDIEALGLSPIVFVAGTLRTTGVAGGHPGLGVGSRGDGPAAVLAAAGFGERLKHLAGLLDLPLGVRTATVQADGDLDTHDNQKDELAAGLKEVSAGLAAFQADLAARGLADRVLTLVWSEFGRRVEQNDTGTGQGAGGIAWVMGSRAKAGILSDHPDLRGLDDDGNRGRHSQCQGRRASPAGPIKKRRR